MSDIENSDKYLPTDAEPMPVREQLAALITRRAPGSGIYKRAYDELTNLNAEVERLTKKRDQQKMRGDNHWETLRSIRKFAEQGDCERIIQWVNDAGSGYTQPDSVTMGELIDRATAAEKSRDEALAELSKALETIGQLRRALSNTVLLRDSWRETCGSVIADTASELGCDADNEEILFAVTRLKTRAQSAEASLAQLREALHKIETITNGRASPEVARFVLVDVYSIAHRALRSLLDEPDKDQNNAKR